jgi:phosphoserine phosphatase
MEMKNQNNIIVLDVCGTCYKSNTTIDFCKFVCKNRRQKLLLYLSTSIIGIGFSKFLNFSFNFDLIRHVHLQVLKSFSRDDLYHNAIIFVDIFLEKKKIQEVHDLLLEFDRRKIIIVSASIDPVVCAVAKKINIENYHSSKLGYKDGFCTGRLNSDLLGNKNQFFSNVSVSLVITDNRSDLELCKMSESNIIISSKRNINFWLKSNIPIAKIIKV